MVKPLDIKREPEKTSIQESGAFLPQHITEERYRMQSKPLGICLIIDCIGNDTEILRDTFTSLGYDVKCFSYQSMNSIIQTLRKIACMPQHQNYDSFVCVLVSRGNSESVFGVDQTCSGFPLDRIRRMFMGDACPSLLGKPKLFFYSELCGVRQPPGGLQYPGDRWASSEECGIQAKATWALPGSPRS